MSDSRMSSFSKAKWPIFLVANVAVLLVVGVSTVRETYRGWTVDNEIKALEQKAQDLEGKKNELADMAIKMQSQDFIEQEARAKLGLQKPGEKVVILEGVSVGQATWKGSQSAADSKAVDLYESNPHKWWRYFSQGN
ncbi:MAG: septum formation initiator family protein [Patescibacteria group bacterium]